MDVVCLRTFSVAVAFVIMLTGCTRSPSAKFYTLTPLAPQETLPSVQKAPVAVKVMPVTIPDYLDRPQIVTQTGTNSLKTAEFNRWAGSLRNGISAVLAENLGLLLGSDQVSVHPGIGSKKVDYSVNMQVVRLDALPGDKVFLKVQWIVSPGQEGRGPAPQTRTFSERLSDSSYETLVTGISKTLEQASREIAGEISGLRNEKSDK
ncbi:PqiC family protein [Pelotalea chapellei]|uniref:Membrane integrity-associated transporter subunit PqiC n=1 Tax=Pelotalea chapellei TaxID=44671 RepID=A0ABS5UBJ3_9BACT|nr:PqiC family protein [Pelotalea chapellei]MBT1072856.1 membrane integrity-associated transporter subunit PqiC [Pelotalea chapellei]